MFRDRVGHAIFGLGYLGVPMMGIGPGKARERGVLLHEGAVDVSQSALVGVSAFFGGFGWKMYGWP